MYLPRWSIWILVFKVFYAVTSVNPGFGGNEDLEEYKNLKKEKKHKKEKFIFVPVLLES